MQKSSPSQKNLKDTLAKAKAKRWKWKTRLIRTIDEMNGERLLANRYQTS
jgi:hypothetical protein